MAHALIGDLVATSRLTIYLLRDVQEPDDAIGSGKSPSIAPLDPASNISGKFYFTSRPATAPAWATYVNPILSTPLSTVFSSSASGLLILKSGGRFFAFTFGYGRGFLDPTKIEHQFGLRVALNRIDASQIRSMDTKTFEDMVVTRSTQASKSTDLPTFGLDVSRDILRAVTGEPRNTKMAKRLSGSDALVISSDLPPKDLPSLCVELLAAFKESTYKTDFAWIDHLALISDKTTIDALDFLVEQQLVVGDTSNSHMAMPEVIDWADVDAFTIGGTRKEEYDDLDLDDYLVRLGSATADITISRLKGRHVSVRFSRSSDFDSRWTVYQCLITEQRLKSKLHVLIEGRWFAVSDSLVSQVDDFANGLPRSTTGLISSFVGEVEAEYNDRLAQSAPQDLLLLDAKIKRPGGAASGIELCDVLASTGEFIHVKRKSRSSTLSHLFAQGTISATTFLGDGFFRDEIRKMIVSDTNEPETTAWLELVPEANAKVERAKYSASFVVIANSTKSGTDWLPFFSKLNLMQNGKQLINLGFRVSISRVDAQ
ncbi:DUF6119 family protein [Cryobacterium sp. Hh38]|uniref:DUF6119 family protein n=1 Tax=Cryobacterium sp. Hh38 TaxID=1259156 RepID=UPI00106D5379|nr:DUF6119 family protein [Cryobacterium sp. Hh38]TFD59582.1 hypothetical protein E3T41_11080 [Cryobacterium sp. Hh38]